MYIRCNNLYNYFSKFETLKGGVYMYDRSRASMNSNQGRRYLGKFGQTKGKFGQTKGKFCHKWQHLWLLAHPIKFGQFYKNSIFGRFNEHTTPHPQSKWFRDAPGYNIHSCTMKKGTNLVYLSFSFSSSSLSFSSISFCKGE